MLNDGNFKKPMNKLHDAGCKNCHFKYADVYLLGRGCGVSQYPQFYDQKE